MPVLFRKCSGTGLLENTLTQLSLQLAALSSQRLSALSGSQLSALSGSQPRLSALRTPGSLSVKKTMSSRRDREVPPLALVWTPIPPISWFLPFVGHLGITDSRGLLHDWHGAYGPTGKPPEEMLFGRPARYLALGRRDLDWDAAIDRADAEYAQKLHCMVFGSDCHSHVARVLNLLRYGGCGYHNKIELALLVFFWGTHVSFRDVVKVWLPPVIVVAIVVAIAYI